MVSCKFSSINAAQSSFGDKVAQIKFGRIAAEVIEAVIEKLASRAWKRNFGSLSPASEQKLISSGVWNPEQELKGSELGLTARLIKHMEKDPYLSVHNTAPQGAMGMFSNSPAGFEGTAVSHADKFKKATKYGPAFEHKLQPSNNIYGGEADAVAAFMRDTAGPTGNLGGRKNKRTARKLLRYADMSGDTNYPFMMHETSEYEHEKPILDAAFDNVKDKTYRGSYSHSQAALNAFNKATDEIKGQAPRMPQVDPGVSTHSSPAVLTEESNSIRFLPAPIKNLITMMRTNKTNEAKVIQEITGKRFGKDEFTKQDNEKLIRVLRQQQGL